jgi:hypothetical protein
VLCGRESMVIWLFFLFSSKGIYKCIYQCVISVWGDVMMRKMRSAKRWIKTRVKHMKRAVYGDFSKNDG